MGWAALVQVPDAVGEVARRTIDGRVVSRIGSARQGLRYSQLPKHAVHLFPFHRVRHAPHQIPRLGPREVQRRDPPNGNNQPLLHGGLELHGLCNSCLRGQDCLPGVGQVPLETHAKSNMLNFQFQFLKLVKC